MPVYVYRNGDDVIEKVFSAKEEHPKFITVGKRRFTRSFSDERVGIPASSGWPMECVASGVHSSQAGELREFFRKNGCPTEVTAEGNPVYRSAAHRRKALKLRGFKDKSSYI